MTTSPCSAAGDGLPKTDTNALDRILSLDAIRSDLEHLYHLLDAAVGEMMNMTRPAEMVGELDRLSAFLWIARDLSQAAVDNLGEALS